MLDTGTFTVSLDFELFWGVRDQRTLSEYGRNIFCVRAVVPYLLDAFSAYGVRCTWATVGLLFFDRKDELMVFIPTTKPAYTNAALSPYPAIGGIGDTEREDPYHYALPLIRSIATYPGQGIGTHTFCHYHCLEDGQTVDAFCADLTAARAAADRLGLTLRSLVFPRNQFNPSTFKSAARPASCPTAATRNPGATGRPRGRKPGPTRVPARRHLREPFRASLLYARKGSNRTHHHTIEPLPSAGIRTVSCRGGLTAGAYQERYDLRGADRRNLSSLVAFPTTSGPMVISAASARSSAISASSEPGSFGSASRSISTVPASSIAVARCPPLAMSRSRPIPACPPP